MTYCPTCGMPVPEIDRLRIELPKLSDAQEALRAREGRLYERVKALEAAGEGLAEWDPPSPEWFAAIAAWRKATGGDVSPVVDPSHARLRKRKSPLLAGTFRGACRDRTGDLRLAKRGGFKA